MIPKILTAVGALLVLAGMGAIAAGAPDWVLGLSLGATLIQSGVIALVGGTVLIALALVLRTLEELLDRFDARAPGRLPAIPDQPEPQPRPALPPATPAIPGMEEAMRARRERARDATPDDAARPRRAAGANGSPAPRPARTLDQAADDVVRLRQEHAKQEQVQQGQREESQRPRRPAPVVPPPPPPSPSDERRRARDAAADEPIYKPKFRPAESVAAAEKNPDSDKVVRSGVIGGMAYTLYADGSIEAELPIGTVRFASINDLQDHVLRTGTEADADFDEQTR